MRLAKFIASCGVASRRKAEELILAGKIMVNDIVVTDVATNVSDTDIVKYNKRVLKPEALKYYLLNKPTGYTSTTEDKHADKLITELVPNTERVVPVGRLDKDTSGLIILTNDGDLAQRITHPKKKIEKEYQFVTDRPLSEAEIAKYKKGIELEDGSFKPDRFYVKSPGHYEVIIHEGRNRIVRRSVEHFGKQIMRLERVRIGKIELGSLKPGKYRELNKNELEGF